MPSIDELAIFARVADRNGITAAATTLGLTPSAVSKALARIEDRLGVRLFNRTTRSIVLTDEGRRFYERASRLLADLEEAESEIRGRAQALKGRLHLSVPVAFGQHVLVPMLPEFRARYGDLGLDLDLNDRVVDLIDEGIDVSIRFGRLRDSSLTARRIGAFTRVVCAAPEYLARRGTPKTPEELLNHDCLIFGRTIQDRLNVWPFDGPGGPRDIVLDRPLVARDGETLLRLTLNGLGIMRLARFVAAPEIRACRLVPLLEEYHRPEVTVISAVYPHRRHAAPKVTAFVDFLAERLGPTPPWERPSTAAAA
jgi:DNA-binding transcriptional LysR family regulator